MKENSLQQQSLGEFLRVTRERLTPEQVGLPSPRRRRTPGLRREEVAYLANVGISWYTSIEQGKNVHPSQQVLESLAGALRLSDDERRYLFLLSKSDVVEETENPNDFSIGLERTVFALEPHPAYILGKYWEVLLWNRAAEYLFRFPPYSANMKEQPNLLNYLIHDPFEKEINPGWEERAKSMVARFRADCARYPQDIKLNEMIEKLKRESEIFRRWWPHYEVKTVMDCHKTHNDPQLGELEFEHVTLQLTNNPDLKLMIYTASSATAEKLRHFLLLLPKDNVVASVRPRFGN